MVLVVQPAHARTEPCRLALVLALDVSGSVNDTEYAQQMNGVALALDSPEVRELILAGAGVDLVVFEWSSQNHQFIVQPWITLDTHRAIDRAVFSIGSYQRKRAGLKTALSTALLFASTLLEERENCWQKKIDISGDGKNNIGPSVDRVYALDAFSEITVNALVVGDPASSQPSDTAKALTRDELRTYYERVVVHGPDAFAMVAHGFEDYARAMQKKLLRELKMPVMAEEVGFEPTVDFHLRRFSRPVHSTTLPLLRQRPS